jgi:hypothetical protein
VSAPSPSSETSVLRGKLANCLVPELGVMFLFPGHKGELHSRGPQIACYIEPCLEVAVVRATDGKIRLTSLELAPLQLSLDLGAVQ